MPECPICRREFDASMQVFAPPGREAYDTVDCARRAGSPGAEAFLAPTLLPTIELLPLGGPSASAPPAALSARSRRRLAAAIAIPLVASPAAIAAGLSLVAAGTATSIFLGAPAFEGGRVVAAPVLPAELPKPKPSFEAPMPPLPSIPVNDEPKQAKPEQPKPEPAKPEPQARVVVVAETPRADTVAQRSEVTASGPAQPATQPGAVEDSGPDPHAAPVAPHSRPAPAPHGSSPHVSRPAPAKPPHPAAPPPATISPPHTAVEVHASPSVPPSHDPQSVSAPAAPVHDLGAKDKDDDRGKAKDKDDGDD